MMGGDRDNKTSRILSLLLERMESEHVPAIAFAYLYIGLKDYDEALKWLDAAYEERDPSLVWLEEILGISLSPRYDVRFQDLVAELRFPDQ